MVITLPHSTVLPPPPSLRASLGPSFVLLGLALGSGELIMWPYLASRWGLGLLWGALLGISLQYVLNTEVMRYTLAWGESVFVGWRKLWRWLPVWFIISTAIPWSIPGFSSASSAILVHLIPGLPQQWVGICLLFLAGILLSSGKSLYQTLEKTQRISIFISVGFVLIITLIITNQLDWRAAINGLMGVGEGWRFFPPAVSLLSFLGAFAYAGAGGNLNLAQSYYVKEKGLGMGAYLPKISSIFDATHPPHVLTGQIFEGNSSNHAKWRQWWKLITQEHLIVFWGLGLISIIFLSVLSYHTTFGQTDIASGNLQFLLLEAQLIGQQTLPMMRVIFLLIGVLMLYTTQIGVLESSARIVSENLVLLTKPLTYPVKMTKVFYAVLWFQIVAGMIVIGLGFNEPQFLLILSAVLNAAAMLVAFGLILLLNTKSLPKLIRPSWGKALALVCGVVCFGYLLVLTLVS